MLRKVFVHSPALDEGGYPHSCPFNSRRAGQTLGKAASFGLTEGADRQVVAPEPVPVDLLAKFHTAEYVAALRDASGGSIDPDRALAAGLGTPDCPIFRGMFDFLSLAAGGSVVGARWIAEGKADIAFNPSGGFHHAHPDHASGFCFINDVVLAAETLVESGRRVAFVDVDAHHCDGVQRAFYSRSDVMTLSMHESGRTLFPGTGFENEIGEGPGRGYCVNLPLPVGTYDTIYVSAFRGVVLPLVRAFNPDVLILELGMDTLAGDPLAHLHLTNNTPTDIVESLMELNKPMLVTGGGGYHIENTVRAWTLCWSVMCGDHSHHDDLGMMMGGVMMENTDWFGGLRDRVLLSDAGLRAGVDEAIAKVVDRVRATVFPLHGI
jgi:acetoin utilization protein AcuC